MQGSALRDGDALNAGSGAVLSLGAPRGRGRGSGSTSNGISERHDQSNTNRPPAARPPLSQTATQRADAAIRATDTDAMGSRLSATLQRYLPFDPYTPMLASSEATSSATMARRTPIINIGTYLRCRAIDSLVANFLLASDSHDGRNDGSGSALTSSNKKQKQILSLGAGSDSRFWRLQADEGMRQHLRHYVELDFADLTKAKVERIVKHRELSGPLGDDSTISDDRTTLRSARYTLMPCDLRNFSNDRHVTSVLQQCLDPNIDTLVIAECVLAYLPPSSSNDMLKSLGGILAKPCAVCYEMCVAGEVQAEEAAPSRFGTVMLNNLDARNLSMPGSRAYATPASHAKRFDRAFSSHQRTSQHVQLGTARTLRKVWLELDEAERQRLSRIEGLDEVEELEMLLSHYAVSWYAYDQVAYAGFVNASL